MKLEAPKKMLENGVSNLQLLKDGLEVTKANINWLMKDIVDTMP